MPTVIMVRGYRLFFYSNEGTEPAHVHVERAEATCKVWLDGVRVAWNRGFLSRELLEIATIVRDHQPEIRRAWQEHFRNT